LSSTGWLAACGLAFHVPTQRLASLTSLPTPAVAIAIPAIASMVPASNVHRRPAVAVEYPEQKVANFDFLSGIRCSGASDNLVTPHK